MKKILPGGLIILAALIAGLFVGNLLFNHNAAPVREQQPTHANPSKQTSHASSHTNATSSSKTDATKQGAGNGPIGSAQAAVDFMVQEMARQGKSGLRYQGQTQPDGSYEVTVTSASAQATMIYIVQPDGSWQKQQ